MNTPIFDRLVSSLSAEERKSMLERMPTDSPQEEDSFLLQREAEERSTISLSEIYQSMGFWAKLWLRFIAYFDKRSKEEVLHQSLLTRLKRKVVTESGKYVDFGKNRFKSDFCLLLANLAHALDFLKNPMEDVVGEHRREYNAYLVGVVQPVLQEKLLLTTDPDKIFSADFFENAEDNDINTKARILIEENLEKSFRDINNDLKDKLYAYARGLNYLERLVSFNYEKVIASYSTDNTCTIKLIFKQLKKLNNIISSVEFLPNRELMQTIFLFSYARQGIAVAEIPALLKQDMLKVEELILHFRKFKEIPLTDILSIVDDDYFYEPQSIGGGEDWFILYRKFWQQRSLRLFQAYLVKRKFIALQVEIKGFYGLSETLPLPGYDGKIWSREIFRPVYVGSLALLTRFFREIYTSRAEYAIQKLYDEGLFIKRANAQELADALVSIPLLKKEIQEFSQAISPADGYFYLQLQDYTRGDRVHGLAGVVDLIERQVSLILERSLEILMALSSVLGGVLERTLGGRYDTISNLESLGLSRDNIMQVRGLVLQTYQFMMDQKSLEERVHRLGLENDREAEMLAGGR
ncbi:DUF5312 family protein [Entomospira culicis]|uniref:Uncharacterized protein n=1 Tax=Entomospira culicis TaxID=2719989 RepID=A0A968KWA7_9SPIO|nr:DUF5312 family protein [Entomospira culicis]NIZ18762.1 hypothetical protein [Entomospira culicis]NIZ68977.1 hypothetical protein [Entomospira culicis]WDI37568.1 DUF5312 family protein [Entomospira culicis]WDI39196.1 DUF5312 family protein [Entomospira culicis]